MKPSYIVCEDAKYDFAVGPEYVIGNVDIYFSSQR